MTSPTEPGRSPADPSGPRGVEPEKCGPVPPDGALAGPLVSPPAQPPVAGSMPAPPEQSREDTDAAWGEYPESARDRLYRDRPPHWDDF